MESLAGPTHSFRDLHPGIRSSHPDHGLQSEMCSTATSGQLEISLSGQKGFYRLRSVDVSATPQGFTNLVNCYVFLGP
jgi:hypothetical protein